MAKEKSITEMRTEVTEIQNRASAIVEKARTEARKLNDAEERDVNALLLEIKQLHIDIATREAMNAQSGKKHTAARSGKFSLRRAIVANMTGQEQRETEAIEIAEATKRHRAVTSDQENGALIVPLEVRSIYTAAAEAATGVVVDEDRKELLLPLEANLVLSAAGVRMMTGLVGNFSWPNHTAANVFWEGENTAAKDGSGDFAKGTVFSPNRLTSYVDISKQLLIQENMSVEGLIRQLLATAIAQKIEQTAFDKAAHASNVPDGMFQSGVENLGAINWANIVKMETEADLQNALFGNLAYIMHPALVGAAKTKVKDASGAGGFLFGNDGSGMLNGYRALRTNNLPKGLATTTDEYGIVFGNWADYFLGQWGEIDIIVDQYTQATKAMVRLIVNSYWNMGTIRKESFTMASMK